MLVAHSIGSRVGGSMSYLNCRVQVMYNCAMCALFLLSELMAMQWLSCSTSGSVCWFV